MRAENENGRPRQGAPIPSNVLNLDNAESTRRRRERALRRALRDAERRRDHPSAALLRAWLLDEAA